MNFKPALLLMAAAAAFAQPPGAPTFDVATVKPAVMPTPQAMMAGKIKIGESIDGNRADYGMVNMEYLITKAYGVKAYQVSGPAWVQSERFDIVAKLPQGATADQVPEMMKALLAERFKLQIHHETKEHAVYALVVGKNGAKIKESAPETPEPANSENDGEKVPGNVMRMTPNGDGRGMTMRGPMGNMKVSMGDGGIRMAGSQMTMAAFIDMIGRFVDKPVVDETGLKGKYDIEIEMSMSDVMTMARSSGMAGMGGPGMGRGGPAGGGAPAEAASDPSGGSIFQTVQNLGLKLEPKKAQMDIIVVDKAEKTPTEN
jgi:uncharacterized protein (TIGR03435 family)